MFLVFSGLGLFCKFASDIIESRNKYIRKFIFMIHKDERALKLMAVLLVMIAMPLAVVEQTDSVPNHSVFQEYELGGVVVSASSGMRSKYLVGNTELIGQSQLRRAAWAQAPSRTSKISTPLW